MSFLFRIIFARACGNDSRNVRVVEDRAVHRSAVGTGVSARAALHCARCGLRLGECIAVESILGTSPQHRIHHQMTSKHERLLAPRRVSLAALVIIPMLSGAATAAGRIVAPVRHSTTIEEVKIDYDAIFDTFSVSEPGHAPGATVSTISYVRAGNRTGGDVQRPVVFAFNGGPGASSIFLHVGMLGPERVALPSDVTAPHQQRYPLVPNGDSILDVADLILIDPVGTGFSRLTDEKSRSYFYSVTGDAAAVANAIEAWSHLHDRSTSAKYILGESYGAVRAVEVANVLLTQPDAAANLRGIVLVSQSLVILDTVQRRSNIVGQVVGLPTIAATAWFHQLAGQGETLPGFAKRAGAFGGNKWLPALFAGTTLDAPERRRIAKGLAYFTGLPARYFLDHDLYLSKEEYLRLALADKGLILGANDTRYTGPLTLGRDPSKAIQDAMANAAPDVLRSQLGIPDPSDYLARAQIPHWGYIRPRFEVTNGDTYIQMDFAVHLLRAMANKPDLRIFIAGGWFDTLASVGADDYLLSRGGLDLKRVTARRYIGGHMFYTDPESRALFASDIRAFVSGHRQSVVRTEAEGSP